MSATSEKILEKLDQQQIQHTPQYIFTWREILLWTFFVLATVLAVLCLTFILQNVVSSDLELYVYSSVPTLYYLYTIPFIWILLCVVFCCILYIDLNKTDTGYKFETPVIAVSFITLCLLSSVYLFASGTSARMQSELVSMPVYDSITKNRENSLVQPENGLLAGEIIEVHSYNHFYLRDFSGKEWEIKNNILVHNGDSIIVKGKKVRLAGKKLDADSFEVTMLKKYGIRSGFGENYLERYWYLMKYEEIV